jgi:hypothetical protein
MIVDEIDIFSVLRLFQRQQIVLALRLLDAVQNVKIVFHDDHIIVDINQKIDAEVDCNFFWQLLRFHYE